MKLSEILTADSKLFAKSEFGPVSDRWPALSFSKHKIATDFANEYRRGRDFIIYVGTANPDTTEVPEHRQNLLSALSVEPRAPISTRDLVPADVWEETVRRWGAGGNGHCRSLLLTMWQDFPQRAKGCPRRIDHSANYKILDAVYR
jgi:hypothetical protein